MLQRRSLDFETIFVPSMCFYSKYICFVLVFDIEVMEFIGIVTSLLTKTVTGANELYRFGVRFIHGMSAWFHALFSYFLNGLQSVLSKSFRMVAGALWRWEALTVVLCLGYAPAPTNGSYMLFHQSTTMCASHLNNVGSTILIPLTNASVCLWPPQLHPKLIYQRLASISPTLSHL